ncbi:type II toxin-antitoxin system VapC family toxin [Candidatus Palauibacter sp.]|uniref:type II toxin-antitoxin system VapC family toxin n=1 Tax=Candidatus Palauibacter sp. TaxID=3101350 RepID=UPI003C704EC0
MKVFVDSNIPMYVAGADHPNRDPSVRFLEEAQDDGLELCTSTEVLQEILYRYAGLGRRELGARVYDLFVALMPEVFDVTLADTDLAKTILLSHEGIPARDAVHAGVMKNRDVRVIATFDRGFDDIEGLTRLEPGRS